ncbi:MAG: SlyX family protein [Verrucomicrobia bacterium]|jgi:SlyX protein|nr:SlyX family protein [Verrucomicrobiota bacterium]
MDEHQRALEERLTFLQRHVEQQDRIILELSREVSKLADRLVRAEAKLTQSADAGDQAAPADERPPHW